MTELPHSGGLHIVAAPLLAGVLLEATRLTPRLAALLPRAPRRVATLLPVLRRLALPALHACAAAILVYALFAFLRPAFTEWVESGVTAVARSWLGGAGIYPAHPPPGRLSVYPYGPLLFQIIGGLYAASGGNAAVVKAAFTLCAALSYLCLFLALRRTGGPDSTGRAGSGAPAQRDTARPASAAADNNPALEPGAGSAAANALAVEIFAIVAGIMGIMVKADGLLIGIACLVCLIGARRGRRLPAWIALCALAGLAAAIKIHGPLYVAPAALALLWSWPGRRTLKIAGGALLAAAIAMAPFLLRGTSIADYILTLRTAAQDGFLPGIFISNVLFLVTAIGSTHLLLPD